MITRIALPVDPWAMSGECDQLWVTDNELQINKSKLNHEHTKCTNFSKGKLQHIYEQISSMTADNKLFF